MDRSDEELKKQKVKKNDTIKNWLGVFAQTIAKRRNRNSSKISLK